MRIQKIRGLNTTLNRGAGVFGHDKIDNALLAVQDSCSRCVMPFMLLEGIAKQMRENVPFKLKEITLGVKEKDFTKFAKSIFTMLHPEAEVTPDYIFLRVDGVPVIIWIIHRKYKFFERPDFLWYKRTEFLIPNPFDKYWKARFLIK